MKLLPYSITLAILIGAGCASESGPPTQYQSVPPADTGFVGVQPQPAPAPAPSATTPPPAAVKQQQQQADKKQAAHKEPKKDKEARVEKVIVSPGTGLHGKVASFNDAGRFVVLTIPPNQMPQVDTELFIYRDDLKIGEVKITGPYRDNDVVADLVSGEAKAGDEVRDK